MSTNIRISEYSVPDRIFGYCFPNRIFGRKNKKSSNFKDFVFVKFASNIVKKVVPRVIMFIPVGAIMRRYGDDSIPVINPANCLTKTVTLCQNYDRCKSRRQSKHRPALDPMTRITFKIIKD